VEKLINEFGSYPTWKKALIIVGFPLVVLLILVRGASTLAALFNSAARERTDKQSNAIDQKLAENQSKIDNTQGKIDQLEESKQEAINNAENTNAADFHNNRNKPDK